MNEEGSRADHLRDENTCDERDGWIDGWSDGGVAGGVRTLRSKGGGGLGRGEVLGGGGV